MVAHISPKDALSPFLASLTSHLLGLLSTIQHPPAPVAQLQKPEHGLLLGSQSQETEGACSAGGGGAGAGRVASRAWRRPWPSSPSRPRGSIRLLRLEKQFPFQRRLGGSELSCLLPYPCNCSCCATTLRLSQHGKTASLQHQGAAVCSALCERALCSRSQLLPELACVAFCFGVHTGTGKLSVQPVTVYIKKV